MSLSTFINQKNRVRKMVGMPLYNKDALSAADAHELFLQLDRALSPQHLYLDGDNTPKQAAAMARMYTAAWNDLKAKGFEPKGQYLNVVTA